VFPRWLAINLARLVQVQPLPLTSASANTIDLLANSPHCTPFSLTSSTRVQPRLVWGARVDIRIFHFFGDHSRIYKILQETNTKIPGNHFSKFGWSGCHLITQLRLHETILFNSFANRRPSSSSSRRPSQHLFHPFHP
jgi:hypothetical protein